MGAADGVTAGPGTGAGPSSATSTVLISSCATITAHSLVWTGQPERLHGFAWAAGAAPRARTTRAIRSRFMASRNAGREGQGVLRLPSRALRGPRWRRALDRAFARAFVSSAALAIRPSRSGGDSRLARSTIGIRSTR
jgi:hypothetical protein